MIAPTASPPTTPAATTPPLLPAEAGCDTTANARAETAARVMTFTIVLSSLLPRTDRNWAHQAPSTVNVPQTRQFGCARRHKMPGFPWLCDAHALAAKRTHEKTPDL